MNLNLRVLHINQLESFAVQKCLIPATKFPSGFLPGVLAKCVLENGSSYAVCRLYTREDIPRNSHCFLNDTVTGGIFQWENQKLNHIIPLKTIQSVNQVYLAFTLNEDTISQHMEHFTLEELKEMAKYLLKPLCLVVGCTIQTTNLRNFGVEYIEVEQALGSTQLSEDTCFRLTPDTELQITDVKLSKSNASFSTFHSYGFEAAKSELEDLLQLCSPHLNRRLLDLNALIVGSAGSGKSSLLDTVIQQLDINCFRIIAAKVLGQYAGETEAVLRKHFEAAQAFKRRLKPRSPVVILLEDLHLFCPATKLNGRDGAANALRISTQLLNLVDGLRASGSGICCLATTCSSESLNENARRAGRFAREITITAPTEEQRKQLFVAMFKEELKGLDLDEKLLDAVVKQTAGYVVADIALLIRHISQALLIHEAKDLNAIITQALHYSQPTTIRRTDVTVYKTTTGFESIGGMQSLKRLLEVSILAGLKEQKAFARFGLSLPKGLLLYGPPGCAKTTIAKSLATEANMTFIATSGAEVYSPYVGCAEKFISKIFDTARKHAPCLIFLDEIDSLVGRRSMDTGSSGSDVQIRILSTLLTEMDGIITNNAVAHILVVAATNRPDMVDDALMRPGRFDKLVHVPAPDKLSRLALLELYSHRMPFAHNVDLAQIAERTKNFSGADICNLCNEAAIQGFQRDFEALEIDMQDFELVLSTQKSSLTQQQLDFYNKFEKRFLSK